MNRAYLFLALFGLLCTLIAIIVSEARQRGASINHFYCFGSATAVLLLLSAGYAAGGLDPLTAPGCRRAVLCYAAAALLNGSGQALCMSNLKQGGRALAYSIPLLSFLLPYGWSLFYEPLSWRGIAGVMLIAASLFYLATRRAAANEEKEHSSALDPKRILIAFAAMTLIGSGQILMSAPSRFSEGSQLSPWSSACVLQAANALFFFGRSAIAGKITGTQLKCSLSAGLIWGVCAAAVYATMLQTLKLLTEIQQGGLFFPVGNGITILLFTGFTAVRFREKLSPAQWAAFAAVVAGIFLVKL